MHLNIFVFWLRIQMSDSELKQHGVVAVVVGCVWMVCVLTVPPYWRWHDLLWKTSENRGYQGFPHPHLHKQMVLGAKLYCVRDFTTQVRKEVSLHFIQAEKNKSHLVLGRCLVLLVMFEQVSTKDEPEDNSKLLTSRTHTLGWATKGTPPSTL